MPIWLSWATRASRIELLRCEYPSCITFHVTKSRCMDLYAIAPRVFPESSYHLSRSDVGSHYCAKE